MAGENPFVWEVQNNKFVVHDKPTRDRAACVGGYLNGDGSLVLDRIDAVGEANRFRENLLVGQVLGESGRVGEPSRNEIGGRVGVRETRWSTSSGEWVALVLVCDRGTRWRNPQQQQ